jgi:hypothetical protein
VKVLFFVGLNFRGLAKNYIMTRDLIQKIFSIIEVTGVEEGGEVEEEEQEEEQLRSLLLSTICTICH